MRLTVLNQMAKGLPVKHKGEQFEEELERVKWFLWHSNVYKALQLLECLELDVDAKASPEARKLARILREHIVMVHVDQLYLGMDTLNRSSSFRRRRVRMIGS